MSKILSHEQLRPFMFGCLFTSGVIVIAHFIGTQSGYMECAADAIEVIQSVKPTPSMTTKS
jgi:hypothetical protein